jgi:DNA-directed RNA polymerase specialized sigma subunit
MSATYQKTESKFLNAKEIAALLGVSQSSAYRIIKDLNEQLKAQGKIIIRGKISRRYFDEKTYM